MSAFIRFATATLTLALCLGAADFGCGHTHTASDTGAKTAAPEPAADKPAARHRDISAEAPGKTIRSENGPPLATSPAGLLRPEAVKKLQEKLVSHGQLAEADQSGKLDGPTHKALREFQRANNMPATGMPDDLTIQKLGLKPAELTRAEPKSQ